MQAPWVNGGSADIVIYTPPGYSTSGLDYPVIYEAPTNYSLWGTAVNTQLDYLIDNGDIPATIMVFISDVGAPFVPSECIDMYNGRQMMETYISKTVVNWVDDHYRTILDARARAIMGFSAGGFCAAMLALRHPDVFNTSIEFSGYFQAGSAGVNSTRPYRDQADMNAHSPDLLAEKLPGSDVMRLYFIVVSAPGTDFIGAQAAYFDKILKTYGFKFKEVDSIYPHGWTEVREETPGTLREWAAQMVRSGIW
jgi:enterochelin esterase-like enzyme